MSESREPYPVAGFEAGNAEVIGNSSVATKPTDTDFMRRLRVNLVEVQSLYSEASDIRRRLRYGPPDILTVYQLALQHETRLRELKDQIAIRLAEEEAR